MTSHELSTRVLTKTVSQQKAKTGRLNPHKILNIESFFQKLVRFDQEVPF